MLPDVVAGVDHSPMNFVERMLAKQRAAEHLGVAVDATPEAVRTAYLRGLKERKPERAPEAYRAWREAYETMRAEAKADVLNRHATDDFAEGASDPPAVRVLHAVTNFELPEGTPGPHRASSRHAEGDDAVGLAINDDRDADGVPAAVASSPTTFERLVRLMESPYLFELRDPFALIACRVRGLLREERTSEAAELLEVAEAFAREPGGRRPTRTELFDWQLASDLVLTAERIGSSAARVLAQAIDFQTLDGADAFFREHDKERRSLDALLKSSDVPALEAYLGRSYCERPTVQPPSPPPAPVPHPPGAGWTHDRRLDHEPSSGIPSWVGPVMFLMFMTLLRFVVRYAR